MSNGRTGRWNFPFVSTSDIFEVTFKGAIWKALGKNKTKTMKENKPSPVLGSTWSGTTCMCAQQGLAGNLEQTGWGRKPFLHQERTDKPGSKTTAVLHTVMYQRVSLFTEQKTKYMCSDNWTGKSWLPLPSSHFTCLWWTRGTWLHLTQKRSSRGLPVSLDHHKHYGIRWVSVQWVPAALWELLALRSLQSKTYGDPHWMHNSVSVPPCACTCVPDPVVYVYLDWEAVAGSQPPWDRIAS